MCRRLPVPRDRVHVARCEAIARSGLQDQLSIDGQGCGTWVRGARRQYATRQPPPAAPGGVGFLADATAEQAAAEVLALPKIHADYEQVLADFSISDTARMLQYLLTILENMQPLDAGATADVERRRIGAPYLAAMLRVEAPSSKRAADLTSRAWS